MTLSTWATPPRKRNGDHVVKHGIRFYVCVYVLYVCYCCWGYHQSLFFGANQRQGTWEIEKDVVNTLIVISIAQYSRWTTVIFSPVFHQSNRRSRPVVRRWRLGRSATRVEIRPLWKSYGWRMVKRGETALNVFFWPLSFTQNWNGSSVMMPWCRNSAAEVNSIRIGDTSAFPAYVSGGMVTEKKATLKAWNKMPTVDVTDVSGRCALPFQVAGRNPEGLLFGWQDEGQSPRVFAESMSVFHFGLKGRSAQNEQWKTSDFDPREWHGFCGECGASSHESSFQCCILCTQRCLTGCDREHRFLREVEPEQRCALDRAAGRYKTSVRAGFPFGGHWDSWSQQWPTDWVQVPRTWLFGEVGRSGWGKESHFENGWGNLVPRRQRSNLVAASGKICWTWWVRRWSHSSILPRGKGQRRNLGPKGPEAVVYWLLSSPTVSHRLLTFIGDHLCLQLSDWRGLQEELCCWHWYGRRPFGSEPNLWVQRYAIYLDANLWYVHRWEGTNVTPSFVFVRWGHTKRSYGLQSLQCWSGTKCGCSLWISDLCLGFVHAPDATRRGQQPTSGLFRLWGHGTCAAAIQGPLWRWRSERCGFKVQGRSLRTSLRQTELWVFWSGPTLKLDRFIYMLHLCLLHPSVSLVNETGTESRKKKAWNSVASASQPCAVWRFVRTRACLLTAWPGSSVNGVAAMALVIWSCAQVGTDMINFGASASIDSTLNHGYPWMMMNFLIQSLKVLPVSSFFIFVFSRNIRDFTPTLRIGTANSCFALCCTEPGSLNLGIFLDMEWPCHSNEGLDGLVASKTRNRHHRHPSFFSALYQHEALASA